MNNFVKQNKISQKQHKYRIDIFKDVNTGVSLCKGNPNAKNRKLAEYSLVRDWLEKKTLPELETTSKIIDNILDLYSFTISYSLSSSVIGSYIKIVWMRAACDIAHWKDDHKSSKYHLKYFFLWDIILSMVQDKHDNLWQKIINQKKLKPENAQKWGEEIAKEIIDNLLSNRGKGKSKPESPPIYMTKSRVTVKPFIYNFILIKNV